MNNPYALPAAELSAEDFGPASYQPRIFSLNGRIGRLRYFSYTNLSLLMAVCVLGAPVAVLTRQGQTTAVQILVWVVYAVATAFAMVVAKRRFHDMNQSGWFVLLLLIPIVNFFVSLSLIFGRGTYQANKYGPAPCANPPSMPWIAFGAPLIEVLAIVGVVMVWR